MQPKNEAKRIRAPVSDVLSEMGSNFVSEWKALNVVAKVTWRNSHAADGNFMHLLLVCSQNK